ncbi:unnamed protein product [Prorocentrum cordatum]|uniref:SAP domain-containing protein n=1 Tax=Prorocentrum cordatum TaxID=2364126 RepID=A0ABN9TR18_9DINO|nr:unnamed protein product [Polarella glacialis]
MYATGSATARGLQCNTYLIETRRPSNPNISSDSTAGRGMRSRVGAGKAFELLKEGANEMTADVLAKYSEWSTILKRCTFLSLMYSKKFKGLRAMAVSAGVVTSASGEKVAVHEEPGQAAVCPAPGPHYVDSEEFEFILKKVVFAVIAAVLFLGSVRACCARSCLERELVQEASDPAPGDADVYLATRTDAEVKTTSVQGFWAEPRPARCDGGSGHELFNAFLVVDLKQILRARGLRVSGLKDDLIMRLIKKGNVLSDRQAKGIEQLRMTATTRGPLIMINLQGLSNTKQRDRWTLPTTR